MNTMSRGASTVWVCQDWAILTTALSYEELYHLRDVLSQDDSDALIQLYYLITDVLVCKTVEAATEESERKLRARSEK